MAPTKQISHHLMLLNLRNTTHESMSRRQQKFLNYHNQKVYDDVISEKEALVYMYLPRKQREKLSIKWQEPCKVITNKHPVYEIEFQRNNKIIRKSLYVTT